MVNIIRAWPNPGISAKTAWSGRLKLKKGVKFHDGSPFNAEVAKWFLKEMETGPSAYMVAGIDRVEINDPHAITIYFKHPEPNMLFNFSQNFMAVPSMEAYKKYGEDYGIKYVIGSGSVQIRILETG